jgi:hypothetical protein
MEVKKYYTHDGSCIYGEEGPFSVCVVFYSDYAALEARYARIIEWMRGRCECCDHSNASGQGIPHVSKICRECCEGDGYKNWTLPAGLEV